MLGRIELSRHRKVGYLIMLDHYMLYAILGGSINWAERRHRPTRELVTGANSFKSLTSNRNELVLGVIYKNDSTLSL